MFFSSLFGSSSSRGRRERGKAPNARSAAIVFASLLTIRALLRQTLPLEPIDCAHDGSRTDSGLPREAGAEESRRTAGNGAPFGGAAAEPSVGSIGEVFLFLLSSLSSFFFRVALAPVPSLSLIRERGGDISGSALALERTSVGQFRFSRARREGKGDSAATGAAVESRGRASIGKKKKPKRERHKNLPPRLALPLASSRASDHHHATRVESRSQRGQARIPVKRGRRSRGSKGRFLLLLPPVSLGSFAPSLPLHRLSLIHI